MKRGRENCIDTFQKSSQVSLTVICRILKKIVGYFPRSFAEDRLLWFLKQIVVIYLAELLKMVLREKYTR